MNSAIRGGLLLCWAIGCSNSDPGSPGSSAGGGGAAAGASSAGASNGGAPAASGAPSAGAPAGGATIAGAGGSSAGTGGQPAAGGAGGGGAPAAAGAGGAAGGGSAVMPSMGCGKSGRPAGGAVTVDGDHIYSFPTTYDGKTPMPMLFALHANANPYTELRDLTNGSRLEEKFVRVFPKSAGMGWNLATDTPRLNKVFDDVLANYCVDTNHVFLTGHSSGAQMDVQMLCVAAGEKRFKAVAPVAASKYCAKISPIPVMYIQGSMDAMRGNSNGADVVAFFTSSNACTATTMPDVAVPMCNSLFNQKPVNPGCITYQGCSAPTVWCSHNDDNYNLTDGHEHGWPCFASNAMADFFLSLP